MRSFLLSLAVLAGSPVFAESDGQESHLSEVAGLRVLHVWTPATPAGSDALFYMAVENRSASEAVLTGAEVMGQTLDLVGFSYGAGGESWMVLPGLPIPAGGELHLEPKVLALRWTSVPVDLVEGSYLEIVMALGGERLQAEVEVGARKATAHRHGGHNH